MGKSSLGGLRVRGLKELAGLVVVAGAEFLGVEDVFMGIL